MKKKQIFDVVMVPAKLAVLARSPMNSLTRGGGDRGGVLNRGFTVVVLSP